MDGIKPDFSQLEAAEKAHRDAVTRAEVETNPLLRPIFRGVAAIRAWQVYGIEEQTAEHSDIVREVAHLQALQEQQRTTMQ